MKTLLQGVIFVTGCTILLSAFGIGLANWGEMSNRTAVVQILIGALGAVVALLILQAILNTGKARWSALLFIAILLLGFSALTPVSLGLVGAPLGLLLLGFTIWKLVRRQVA